MSNTKKIELQDGDDLTIVNNESSAYDPTAGSYVARTFRVILVNGPDPVLELIPIGSACLCEYSVD